MYNKSIENYYSKIRKIVQEHCRDPYAAADIVADLSSEGLIPNEILWALINEDGEIDFRSEEEVLAQLTTEGNTSQAYYKYDTDWCEFV